MKKFVAIIISVILLVTACACFAACDGEGGLKLYVPDGAPAMSVVKIMNDGKVGADKVKTMVTTGEDVVAKCASGEADMAVLPTNAAVKICHDRNDYLLFSVNVYGVLYVVGTEQINNISELQGQTLHSIGLGNTPEYVFKAICDNKGVRYEGDGAINIVYATDASSINPLVLSGDAKFALIGEPAVTQLSNKLASKGKQLYNLFDLQAMWQELTGSEELGYPQASMIVKKSLLSDVFAHELSEALYANAEFATAHLDQLNGIMRGAGSSLDLIYTEALLERCNLRAIPAALARDDLSKYLAKFGAVANFLSDDIFYEAND